MVLKFLLKQMNALLLIAALVLTVWGTVVRSDSLRYVGAAVSLIILDFLIERLSLNDRLLAFLESTERADGASLDDLLKSLTRVEQEVSILHSDLSNDSEQSRDKLSALQASLYEFRELLSRHVVSFFPLLAQDTGSSRKFHELRLLYALRGARIPGNGAGLEVGRNETIRLWRDALIESRTWDALSSADELWDKDEREISESYQDLQRRLGAQNRLRRVFVLDSAEELLTRRELLREQAKSLSHGNLRWVLRTELSPILERRGFEGHQIANDLDFAVVDNAFVLWFRLGPAPDKPLLGSRLVNDEPTLEDARQIFNIAFNIGKDFEQAHAER